MAEQLIVKNLPFIRVLPSWAQELSYKYCSKTANLYILHGNVRHEYGDKCKQVLENTAGDFIYIQPGVPHEVFNMSDTEPVVAVVARSDASEWENIVPYDRESGKVIEGQGNTLVDR